MGTPQVIAERFELGALIGRGSAADVHRARDRQSGGDVAIKLAASRVDPAIARWRFEREAAALSVLGSPHVVRLIAAGAEAGRPYLILELLRGQTFEAELAAGPLAASVVVSRVTELAAALELAHGLGIVHRDLKPANLFLHEPSEGPPIVKVLDFGLAHDAFDVRPDGVVGTPLYMAPEQVRAQVTRIGPASDGWALGMVALTLLTGETYWAPGSATEVIAQIETMPMYAPSTRWRWLPSAFDAWFARATHRVAEKRFRGVADQVAALSRVLADVQTIAAAPRPGRRGLGEASTMAGTPTPSIVRAAAPGRRPLVGRGLERASIAAQLTPGAVVSLLGTSGVGKSRLAEAVAADLGERLPDGAWVVALGGVLEAAELAEAIGHALGLAPDATVGARAQVAAALGPRRALIVLDGAEHLAGAGEVIASLRQEAPDVSWLVTTRVALGIAGEQRVPVTPLDLPGRDVSAEEAASYPAIELFELRVRAVDPEFRLTEDAIADVIAICRLVDGLPLGLELAAAQVRTRGLADVRLRLERSAARPDDPVRAAVAWSYDLLAPDHQALLRHLAVLPSGLTFPDLRASLGHVSEEIAGAVMRLLESGLASWSNDDPPRLVMLDGVRELCRRTSRDGAEDEAIWSAALDHLHTLARRAEAGLRTAEQERWLDLLDAEHDNLRAAIDHALIAAPAAALALAGRLAWYWYLRGHYEEGSTLLGSALARTPDGDVPDRLRALHGAGRLALLECDYERARELLVEARAAAERLGDRRGIADASQLLGSVARELGDYGGARRHHAYGLALWQNLGDRREAARARNYLAFVGWLGAPDGRPDAADDPEGERELRALGDVEGTVWALLNRGAIAHHAGDPAAARVALEAAFAEAASARFQAGIAWSLELRGRVSLAQGELLQARAQLHASLRVQRRLGDLWRCASVLDALAAVLVADGRPARGAVYLGASDAVRARIQTPAPACEVALRDACIARGEAAIGEAFAAGRVRGRRMRLDDVVAMAAELI